MNLFPRTFSHEEERKSGCRVERARRSEEEEREMFNAMRVQNSLGKEASEILLA
jgi:hypothetical protein